jgi:hypothetical protein
VKEEKPVVFAKCKRGSDQVTGGQSCDSKLAFRLSDPQARVVLFQCKKCNHQWSVPVGGGFEL